MRLVSASVAAALVVCLGVDRSGRAAGPQPSSARSVVSLGMTVSSLDASVAFFRDVLAFEEIGRDEAAGRDTELLTGVFGARTRTARLRLGSEVLELTEFVAAKGREYPPDTRANDHWFQHAAIVVSDMDRAFARLREHRVTFASTGPQRLPDWNLAAGGIRAFYFRDPDGHFLELLEFPPGKGERRWQDADRLFLGIDHTAIVSGDTERSLRFYRDGLGLRVAGSADNHGEEQEHLNNVFGVRLRITTLRAAEGPGVELLDYLAPRGGRPAPVDVAASDLMHWQTTIALPGIERFIHQTFGGWLVSPVVVRSAMPAGGRLLVRDPDAHGVRLVEP